ncbi:MAG: response regulator, partial [Anaerolineae bacterium]
MDATHLRIIIGDDEPAAAEAIRRAFEAADIAVEIETAGTLAAYQVAVAARPPDIALVHLNLPGGGAIGALTAPPEAGPCPVLVMTSTGNEQTAVEVMKAGALDYVVESAEAFVAMPHTVARALREWKLLHERKRAEEALRESETRFRLLTELISDYAYELRIRPDGTPRGEWLTESFTSM